MRIQHRFFLLWLILMAFVALAWAYGLVMPPFENLDEVEHFSAIRYVADTGSLPVHDPVLQEHYRYRQEASQPPLYYILVGGLTRLLGLRTDDTNSYLVSNPFVACGPSDNPYNKHTLYHNPSREAFSLNELGTLPWDGALLTLHILRALTPFLQVVTIVGVYAIARLVLPQHPQVAPLAAALTAFNPQFLLVASGVNNDNLVTPLATAGLYLALVTRQRGPSLGRSLSLGALAGLAGLSKLSGLLLLGLVGTILLEAAWRSRIPLRYATGTGDTQHASHSATLRGPGTRNTPLSAVIGHGLLIGVVAASVCGWWFWRNWQLYGDPVALGPMLDLVGRREASTLPLNESGLMFRSFWGQIACAFFSDRFYFFFGLLTVAGLVGLLVGWLAGRENRHSRLGMLFLALWFGIIFAGWLRWGSITAATGGRLLFPAIAATSTLLAYGLSRLWPEAWRGWVATVAVALLAVVALATLLWELRPFFTPPRTYAEADTPLISRPLEATFDSNSQGDASQIALLGYDAEISPSTGLRRAPLALPARARESSRSGRQGEVPYLDVTFYWQARTFIPQDYALAIQLTSPVPGDDSLRFNYNTWPGRGNYPTTVWLPGQVIADHYHFRLPASDAPTQAWQLLVAFYEVESGDRLPVRLGAQEVGDSLALTTLRVPGRSPDCSDAAALAEPVHFGPELAKEIIALTDATVQPPPNGPHPESTNPGFQVSLCWNSLAPTLLDYTVFVHLYDENDELLATGDGPPMNDSFPTRLWQPGDVIADVHFIPYLLPPPGETDSYRIGVGLYDPISGERLQAVQAGQPLLNQIVFLDTQP